MDSIKYMLCISFVLFVTCSCSQVSDSSNLLGNNFDLFKETPVWDLAKAVQNEDTVRMKQLIVNSNINIDFQEPKFGKTLLMLSVINEHYKASEVLLENGANPNLHDFYTGASPMIFAADIQNKYDDNTKFLKLLLKYNGNPNDEESGVRKDGNTIRETPLLIACSDLKEISSPLNKVEELVQAGANVDYTDEFDNFPLKEALLHNHLDVVLYLLKKGARFDRVIVDRSQFSSNGRKLYIGDMLREITLPLNSKEYLLKMDIVEFLSQRGINYKQIPIPEYIIEEVKKTHPVNWKEYLEKY